MGRKRLRRGKIYRSGCMRSTALFILSIKIIHGKVFLYNRGNNSQTVVAITTGDTVKSSMKRGGDLQPQSR